MIGLILMWATMIVAPPVPEATLIIADCLVNLAVDLTEACLMLLARALNYAFLLIMYAVYKTAMPIADWCAQRALRRELRRLGVTPYA